MKNSAPFCALVLSVASAVSIGAVAQNTTTSTKPKTATTTAKKPVAKTGAAKAAVATKAEPGKLNLTTPKEKASYALGYNLGRNLKGQMVDVDPAIVTQAIKDAFAGTPSPLTEEEIRTSLAQLQQETRAKLEAKVKEMTDENEKAGQAFLAANKTKEGVVTLPSGLEYKVLTAGTGPKPAATDTVVCNYRGTLIDGKEFDSSYKRGEPATFPVTGVIKGWTEALQLMPVGSKWQLFVPASLAYGDRGAGDVIPPGSTLVFEVELLSIKPKEAPTTGTTEKPGEALKPATEAAKPATQSGKPAETKPATEPPKPQH
ncbi:MAG: FKBP-type peptidyl-prolyl cis-trans isomerase [Terriglobia bacterium]|jgi:FKBP-type peptidyl-prolyl cis-trans isomerase|nr:FKBP-type peptidyl-prolyl cis-trans isomerase [Terriglobia bacterium]